jgi:hypothetical protein
MARWSGALYRPLGDQSEPKMKTHDIVCIHTMVGYLWSTDQMFRSGGYTGTESHFGIGGKWGSDVSRKLDGQIYQWQDTVYSADANLDGWHRVISIETADNAPKLARDIEAWTPRQVESIAQTVAWCCRTYDIPAVLVPDSKPGRRGIAYHRQGIDPWRVTGGERWSSKNSKECPADRRIAQIKSQIIPRVNAILNPPKPKPPEEPTVADEALNPEWNTPLPTFDYLRRLFGDTDGKMSRWEVIMHAAAQSYAANQTAGTALEELAKVRAQNTVLAGQVTNLAASVVELKGLVEGLRVALDPEGAPTA